MHCFKIDEAVKHVKIIADNNRCPTCDKLYGLRLRYFCGHIICGECVEEAKECFICIGLSKSSNPQLDNLKKQQVLNASFLLTTFQDAFNVDVYKRSRLSEKLKIEEQVFPKLFPVSVTYFNKRRGSQSSTKENVENVINLDGETISNLNSTIMNTRVNIVQKWLDENEKIETAQRKPFSDINLNRPIRRTKGINIFNLKGSKLSNRKKNINKNSKNVKLKVSSSKSVRPAEPFLRQSLLKSKNKIRVNNEIKPENKDFCEEILQISDSCNKSESGISDKEINTIIVQDSLSPVVDKDKQAWLAGLELNNSEKQVNNCTIRKVDECKSHDKLRKNVCFYKKYFLFKSCYYCLNNCENHNLENQTLTNNDVSITIKRDSTITSVHLIKNVLCEGEMISKHSVDVQTEENYVNEDKCLDNTFISLPRNKCYPIEKNLKPYEKTKPERVTNLKGDNNKGANLQCVVINDSDSDSDINCSGTFEVTADVHRSSNMDYSVLSPVDTNNYRSKLRQSRVRRTIDSNNSSEKENVEPNKAKKLRLNKKNELKK